MSTADIRKALLEAEILISSPTIALTKIRYIGEALTSILARKAGLAKDDQETQVNFLRRLEKHGAISKATADDLHQVRMLGNDAVHQNKGTIAQAGEALALIRSLLKEHLGLAMSSATVAADTALGVKAKIKQTAAEKSTKDKHRTKADIALSTPLPTLFSVCWRMFVNGWPWALGIITILAAVLFWPASKTPDDRCIDATLSSAARADLGCNEAMATEPARLIAAAPTAVAEAEPTLFIAAAANIRDRASTAMGQVVGQLPRGTSVTGVIVHAEDSEFTWLRLNEGRGFVSMVNLSPQERPTLVREWLGTAQLWKMEGFTPLHERPTEDSAVLENIDDLQTVVLSGVTADGWAEVKLADGGVGYFAVTEANDRTRYLLTVIENPAVQPRQAVKERGDTDMKKHGYNGEYVGEDSSQIFLLGFNMDDISLTRSTVGYGRYEKKLTQETCHSLLRLSRQNSNANTYVFDQVARPGKPDCEYFQILIQELSRESHEGEFVTKFLARWVDVRTGVTRFTIEMTSR